MIVVLRQRASEPASCSKLVADGQTVEITDRGRRVAILAPMPGGLTPLERLRRGGAVVAAKGMLADLAAPLAPTTDELPSEVLQRLRLGER